jgi:FtsH-binding integral membrane protein
MWRSLLGGLAVYGTVTKQDLGGFGQMLFMGLLGLVIASVVAVFWHSDAFQFVLSFIGVLVFSGLTAYDAQRLKLMALEAPAGTSSYAIVGALALYLQPVSLPAAIVRQPAGLQRLAATVSERFMIRTQRTPRTRRT